MKNLKNILRYMTPYWVSAALNVLFNILAVLFSLVSFMLFIPILQMLFHQTKIPDAAPPLQLSFQSVTDNFNFFFGKLIIDHGEKTVLVYIGITIILLYFFKNFFRYMAMYFLAVVRNGVVKDLRNEMYQKILILPLGYYSQQRKGDIMSRMTSDVQEVENSIMSSLEMVFRDPIQIITYLVTLFIISPKLTLFVLVLLPVSGFFIGRIGKSLKRTSTKGQQKMGTLLSMIEETLSGLRIIKAFNAISFSNKRFQNTNNEYFKLMVHLYRKRDLASPLSEFLGALVLTVVLWYGGRLVLTPGNLLDAAVFLVYLGIFSQVIPPAKSVTQAYYNIQKGVASMDRINYVFNEPEVIEQKADAISKKDFLHQDRIQRGIIPLPAGTRAEKYLHQH